MNLFCKLGLHTWVLKEVWHPSITAKVVTRFELLKQCTKCPKKIKIADYNI